MDNVIVFPKAHRNPEKIISHETIKENIASAQVYHVISALNTIAPHLFNQLEMAGFEFEDIGDKTYTPDITFVAEAIKSLMFKYYGIDHPFQKISNEVFTFEGTNEDDQIIVKIVDELHVILKEKENDLCGLQSGDNLESNGTDRESS